jgi:hypothetical protein
MTLQLNFLIYEENFVFFFISVLWPQPIFVEDMNKVSSPKETQWLYKTLLEGSGGRGLSRPEFTLPVKQKYCTVCMSSLKLWVLRSKSNILRGVCDIHGDINNML